MIKIPHYPVNTQSFLFLLVVLSFSVIALSATDLYVPSLPEVASQLAHSSTLAQLTLTTYLIGLGLSQFIYGPISDQIGRRPVILAGLAIFLFGSIICSLSPNITSLLVGRFIQGVGIGSAYMLSGVLLSDAHGGNKLAKSLSYLSIVLSLSPAIAPFFGGLIQNNFGFRGNFIALLIMAIISLIISALFLPETHHHKQKINLRQTVNNFQTVLNNRIYLKWLVIGGFAFSGLIGYSLINPFIFQDQLGFNAFQFGMVTLLIAAGLVVGAFINGYLVQKFGTLKMIICGILCNLVAGICMLAFSLSGMLNMYVIVAPLLIATIGLAILFPNTYANALNAVDKNKGIAGACFGASQVVLTTLVSGVIALVPNPNLLLLAIVFTVIGLISLILVIRPERVVKTSAIYLMKND